MPRTPPAPRGHCAQQPRALCWGRARARPGTCRGSGAAGSGWQVWGPGRTPTTPSHPSSSYVQLSQMLFESLTRTSRGNPAQGMLAWSPQGRRRRERGLPPRPGRQTCRLFLARAPATQSSVSAARSATSGTRWSHCGGRKRSGIRTASLTAAGGSTARAYTHTCTHTHHSVTHAHTAPRVYQGVRPVPSKFDGLEGDTFYQFLKHVRVDL